MRDEWPDNGTCEACGKPLKWYRDGIGSYSQCRDCAAGLVPVPFVPDPPRDISAEPFIESVSTMRRRELSIKRKVS